MEGDAPEEPHRREQPERRNDARRRCHELAGDGSCVSGRCRWVSAADSMVFDVRRLTRIERSFNRNSPPARIRHVRCVSANRRSRRGGLGAAHRAVASAHDVEVFEQHDRRGRARKHGAPRRPRARHRLHRAQRAQLPALRPAAPRARRGDPPPEMSFSVSCGDCGLEWSGAGPFAQGRRARGHALPLAPARGRPLAAHAPRRALEDGSLEGRTLGAYVDERGYSRRFRRHFLCRSPPPSGRARRSTRSTSRPRTGSASSSATACSASAAPLADDRRRRRHVRGRVLERLRGRGPSRARACARSGATTRGVELVTDDGETRRFDNVVARDARGPVAARSSPTRATTSAGCSAPGSTRRTRPFSTPTSASCPASRRRGRRGTTS